MNLTNDRKYAIVMLVLSLTYCISAFNLDADFDPTHEKFYPFALSIAMIVMSLALLVRPSLHSTTWPGVNSLQKIGMTIVAILIYSLVLHTVGFLICASLLMGVCMWVFEAERKWIVPVSITVAISFYIIFDRLLGLTLPAGILNFL